MSNGPLKKAPSAGNLRSGICIAFILGSLSLAGPIVATAQQSAKPAPKQTPMKATAQPAPQPSPTLPQAPPPSTPPPTENGSGSTKAADREKAIVKHLNAVLRFYHDSAAPIQKVGEPSDLIYRDQTATLATQIAGFAFQSAQAEAALHAQPLPADQSTDGAQTQAQKLQTTRDSVAQRIVQLKAQDEALEKQ